MQTENKTISAFTARGRFVIANPLYTQKRIGSTVYEIEVYVKKDSAESVDEKIMRLIRNDLNLCLKSDKMIMPQTSRLSERSSA